MTLSDLIALARAELGDEATPGIERTRRAAYRAGQLARAVSDLLSGPGDECGFERPVVTATGDVWVPPSWTSAVSPDDAEAMARMLLRAAAETRTPTPGKDE